jgi:hypothetical protein
MKINMNKFTRRQMKVAKLKRREAMIYGEITPYKKDEMEKYDVYFTEVEPSLYKSYNCKAAIKALSEKEMKVSLDSHESPGKEYRFYKMDYEEWSDSHIILNGEKVPCMEVVAEYQWVESIDGTPHYWSEWETLFYYVDDSIEW